MSVEQDKVETVKMVDHALKVLDLLRGSNRKLGVNEIAKICGLTPSSAFRILKTLELNGWVYQCNDKSYIIGEKIGFVTEKNNFYLAFKEIAAFTMNRFTEEFGQAMNLIVREGSRCYILQQSRTKNIMDYVAPVGSELPFYACAGGKILLSELPMHLVDKIIESRVMTPYTANTITDPDAFWRELRSVAKQGYAFDNKESAINGSCIAVAVRDYEGTIIGGLSFSGFVGVDDTEDLLPYLTPLNDAADEISRSLFKCRGDQGGNISGEKTQK